MNLGLPDSACLAAINPQEPSVSASHYVVLEIALRSSHLHRRYSSDRAISVPVLMLVVLKTLIDDKE